MSFLQDPRYLIDFVALALVLIGASLVLVALVRRESSLAWHVPQILYLAFLLPVVLLLSVIIGISKDAVVGLLGIIIGYIFGIGRPTSVQDLGGIKRAAEAPMARPAGEERPAGDATPSRAGVF
jgi:hypothetical protein